MINRASLNFAQLFELYRRKVSKFDYRAPSPYFSLENIDIPTLYKCYCSYFPVELKVALKENGLDSFDDISFPPYQVRLQTCLFTRFPIVDRYNELFKEFEERSKNTAKTNEKRLLLEEYKRDVYLLSKKIGNDIKDQFTKAIMVLTPKNNLKLKPHVDTLLFACIFFYNKYWDADGTSFAGSIAYHNTIEDLTFEHQPFNYRSYKQGKIMCEILYNYFVKEEEPKEIYFSVGGKSSSIRDPLLTKWLIRLIIDSLKNETVPISLGNMASSISRVLHLKNDINCEDFLNKLAKIRDIDAPTYIDDKRKIVRQYCLQIHIIFSHYLGLSVESFSGKRVNIYHNILELFQMDSFKDYRRKPEVDDKKSNRVDAHLNRLRALLTSTENDNDKYAI